MRRDAGPAQSKAAPAVSAGRARHRIVFLHILLIAVAPSAAAGYNLYYGNLHSHTSYSDGESVPRHAFAYARDTAGIDVLAVTDHGELLSPDEWADTRAQADSATVPDSFVGLAGFEWSSPFDGHANVLNTIDKTSVFQTPTPGALYSWLAGRPGALAQFNHPTAYDFRGFAYSADGDRAFASHEMQNPGHAAIYHVPLDSGWHVGLTANQDNHSADWGAGERLTGIWAGALDRDSILSALARMRVFGTLDRNAWLRFTVGDSWMGSTVSNGRLEFSVAVADPDSAESIARVDLVTNQGVVQDSLIAVDTNYVEWQPVVDTDSDACRYFFVRATMRDMALVVSSPIWTEPATALAEHTGPRRLQYGLRARPNPFRLAVSIRPCVPGVGSLAVYDAAGARIWLSRVTAAAVWDGRDASGRAVPAGVYIARWSSGGKSAAVRLLRISAD